MERGTSKELAGADGIVSGATHAVDSSRFAQVRGFRTRERSPR